MFQLAYPPKQETASKADTWAQPRFGASLVINWGNTKSTYGIQETCQKF